MVTPGNTYTSSRWYSNLIRRSKNLNYFPQVNTLTGKLIFFTYFPLLRQRLGHYDKSPLVFVLSAGNGQILGLNVHYLDLVNRKILVDALYRFGIENSTENQMRLKFQYSDISKFLRGSHVKNCIKRYNIRNIKNIAIVPHTEWNQLVHLPLHDFGSEHKEQAVWNRSRKNL